MTPIPNVQAVAPIAQGSPLLDIPENIFLQIFLSALGTMDIKDIISCSQTCKPLKERMTRDDTQWTRFFWMNVSNHYFGSDYPKEGPSFYATCMKCFLIRENFQSGVYASHHFEGHQSAIGSICTSDGKLYSGSKEGIQCWDLKTETLLYTLMISDNLSDCCSLCIFNETLYAGFSNGEIMIWDLKEKKWLGELQSPEPNQIYNLVVSNGTLYSSTPNDKYVLAWDLEKRNCLRAFKAHKLGVGCLISCNERLYSCSGREIKIWDTNTKTPLETHQDQRRINFLAFSDKGILCSGTSDGMIEYRDPETGDCVETFQAHTALECPRSFKIADKQYSQSEDGSIKIWTGRNPQKIFDSKIGLCLPPYEDPIAANEDFETAKRTYFQRYLLSTFEINSFVFFDGKIVTISTNKNRISVWNPEERKHLYNFPAAESMALSRRHPFALLGGKLCLADNNRIMVLDFTKKHQEIFKELVSLLRTKDQTLVKQAMERFSNMPVTARNKIYSMIGEDISGTQFLSATPEEQAEAIEKHLAADK